MFSDTTTGIILFITHILSCITVGFIFRFWKYNENFKFNFTVSTKKSSQKNTTLTTFSNLGEGLSISIKNAISTVVMIGGFVILFSVIISILNNSHFIEFLSAFLSPILSFFKIPQDFSNGIISGLIELTNGVKNIANIPYKNISINIIITAFLLGFGGFSVLLQVWGIISKTDISIFPYFIAKLLQGIIAAFYTHLILSNFRLLNLDLAPNITNNHILFISLVCILIFSVFFKLYRFQKKQKRHILEQQ